MIVQAEQSDQPLDRFIYKEKKKAAICFYLGIDTRRSSRLLYSTMAGWLIGWLGFMAYQHF